MKTNCAKKCSSEDEGKCQPFPKNGPLKGNMNLSLECLKEKLKTSDGDLYSYVVDTVEKENGNFIQTGSGPNFQDGYITLCSCKHEMRTIRPLGWEGVWVAGLTNKDAGNYLFYLMKITEAHSSQYDIWNSSQLKQARTAKNARYSKFGDIFEPSKPINNSDDKYNTNFYHPPCNTHVHINPINDIPEWHGDIDSDEKAKINKTKNKRYRRKAAMLLGDGKFSFIWSKGKIRMNPITSCESKWCSAPGRKYKRCKLQNFLKCLSEETNVK